MTDVKINDQIVEEIEKLRKKMIEIANAEGYTSKDAIKVSRELDKLLNAYNRNKVQNKINVGNY